MLRFGQFIGRATPSGILAKFTRCSITRRNLLTLAIETSCDDTAVAVVEKSRRDPGSKDVSGSHAQKFTSKSSATARLIFNKKITAPNTGLGGIHPIEALESHQRNLGTLIAEAVANLPELSHEDHVTASPRRSFRDENGKQKRLPDFISVTRGPGMRTNLSCGLDTAKGLATAWQLPLVGVHHMQAHALTPRLVSALVDGSEQAVSPTPEFPFLTLLVSGGHTMLLHSRGLTEHKILATTADIAIGDALDKCGRVILPSNVLTRMEDTAFAKHLSEYGFGDTKRFSEWPIPAQRAHEIDKPPNRYGWQLQTPLAKTRHLAFSFSGVATSAEKLFRDREALLMGAVTDDERRCFAQTSVATAFEHLASRTIIALEELRDANEEVSTLVVSGGVAANDFLRHFLRAILDARGFRHVQLQFPPPWLCTDNAAMIAWCGLEMFEAGYRSMLNVRSIRKWSMDPTVEGGILGAPGWISS